MGYLTKLISTNVDAMKHIADDFLSERQHTGVLCVQHGATTAALSINTAFE